MLAWKYGRGIASHLMVRTPNLSFRQSQFSGFRISGTYYEIPSIASSEELLFNEPPVAGA
jgi:hypothetical protein